MTLTVPEEFWPILQENRDLLHGIPMMAAEAIQLWAKDKGKTLIRALRVLGPKLSHGQDRSAGGFSIYREIVA